MHRLNFHHLHYFWAVAREGHLTRAAERLHVSQSALSSQIRQLEAQLGQPLFEREGRSLSLTETGRMVLSYAESIFSLGKEMMAALDNHRAAGIRRLRVGSDATLSRNFQENFLRPLLAASDTQLLLRSGQLETLLPLLKAHELDVILSNRPVSSDARQPWRCRPLSRQSVCLVGPPRRDDQPFRLPQSLQDCAMILPGPDSELRGRFSTLCEQWGVTPKIRAEVDDMAMLRLLARDAGCVALVPAVVVQDELQQGQLVQYCTLPQVEETFYAITVERQFQPPGLAALLAAWKT
ncbi:LysR family transcriptional regulator [Paludibacterium sp. THUN1379]|uniref:LysR family transcriptional regulator n=1 Tax=Paludibacterium sp. THUN1379 TaxID=3112107 RepID=UPI00308A9954|nr:LysR family transcriptional regulator [Paludibacterium sp. THUN1379]